VSRTWRDGRSKVSTTGLQSFRQVDSTGAKNESFNPSFPIAVQPMEPAMPPYRPSPASFQSLLSLVLLLAGTLALGGCPREQGATSDSGEQQAEEPPSRYKGVTRVFVERLSELKVYAYTVSDEGAAVVYEELSFNEDGSFEAATSIRLGEEPFTCRELGAWTMDDGQADDESSAALTLEITETDCAGRSTPASFRIRARITNNEIELSHI